MKRLIVNKGLLTIRQASEYIQISIARFKKLYLDTHKVGVYEREDRVFVPKAELDKEIEDNTRMTEE